MTTDLRIDSIPTSILVCDNTGSVVDANQAACELIGRPKAEIVGSAFESAPWFVPLASDSARPGALARILRPDGTNRWVQVDTLDEAGADDVAGHSIVGFSDVTSLLGSPATGHVFSAALDELDESQFDAHAVLDTALTRLSKLRPGTWVAVLLTKDPTTATVLARNTAEPELARYVQDYVATLEGSDRAPNTGITQRVVESGVPALLPEMSIDELVGMTSDNLHQYLRSHPVPTGIESLGVLFVPMRARGATIGSLGLLERLRAKRLDSTDVEWVQALADRTARAIENAQLYEDAARRLERLNALEEVALAVTASPELKLTLQLILDQVTAHLGVDAADILLVSQPDNALVAAASVGFRSGGSTQYRMPVAEDMALGTGRRIETITALGAFAQLRRRSLFARESFRSYGAVPLIGRGQLIGLLEVFHRSPLTGDPEWFGFLDALASQAAIAIDSATTHEKLRHAGAGTHAAGHAIPRLGQSGLKILRLVVSGTSNREIAEQLHLSQNTVKSHVRQILEKTGATNRTDLTAMAIREGWV